MLYSRGHRFEWDAEGKGLLFIQPVSAGVEAEQNLVRGRAGREASGQAQIVLDDGRLAVMGEDKAVDLGVCGRDLTGRKPVVVDVELFQVRLSDAESIGHLPSTDVAAVDTSGDQLFAFEVIRIRVAAVIVIVEEPEGRRLFGAEIG